MHVAIRCIAPRNEILLMIDGQNADRACVCHMDETSCLKVDQLNHLYRVAPLHDPLRWLSIKEIRKRSS